MQTYLIQIVVKDDIVYSVDVSGNTPCLLEDEIKRVVDRFYGRDKK